jgi:hypothetical protein
MDSDNNIEKLKEQIQTLNRTKSTKVKVTASKPDSSFH